MAMAVASALAVAASTGVTVGLAQQPGTSFDVMETTIEEIHQAFKDGRLTARQLVQLYLD
jgi:hypothetical protein